MARKQIVNGKVYDWSSVTIGMSGCGGIEPKEISYDDEKEKTLIYGKGGRIRGYGTGQAKNAVKISMLREDFILQEDQVLRRGGSEDHRILCGHRMYNLHRYPYKSNLLKT